MPVTAPFDCVVLSTNLDPLYWQFFPSVARAWTKLFNVPVHLAVVGHSSREQTFRGAFARGSFPGGFTPGTGGISWLEPVAGIPESTQAKLARYYLAASLSAQTRVLLHDIDFLPLNAALIAEQLGDADTAGVDLVTSDVAAGAETGALLATSGFLAELLAPAHQGWETFLQEMQEQGTPARSPTLSTRALLHALVGKLSLTRRVCVRQRGYAGERLIDCNSQDGMFGLIYDRAKLAEGFYAGARLPRPLLKHFTEVHPLLEYLGI